ncbi:Pre-mRNA splicing Prp18-interacting factor-domain-containing protein [Pelagophyceae sp. CCMP2097]|nr:Pre-mRNA splicing Prp18-interacting factor-domain-containing protein [Pelagophyceae sp. CCMP2097]
MNEADAALKAARSSWKAATGGAGAPAIVNVGAWIEALYRGKTPYLPARVEKVRLDGTLDLSYEGGKKAQAVPQAHVKLPKSASGSRAGLETLGKVTYDAKRDRWHGFDTHVFEQTVDLHKEIDAERARKREAEREEQGKARKRAAKAKAKAKVAKAAAKEARLIAGDAPVSDESDSGSDSDSDADNDGSGGSGDEFVAKDENQTDFQKRMARQGGLGGAQMKTTVRNLRIREDTAKYLRNLDPDSAFYDPKSRAMRENPTPNVDASQLVYAGDNFARATGDALELAATQCFAWDVERKGATKGGDMIHVLADPSRAEFLKREFKVQAKDLEAARAEAVALKYGAASSDELPEEKRLRQFGAQSENYAEYGADGRVVRGAQLYVAKSKYAEDVFDTNHTAVWGSFFCPHRKCWGYADDHSVIKNSYSTGAAGIAANAHAAKQRDALPPPREVLAITGEPVERQKLTSRSAVFGDVEAPRDLDLDEAKVQASMKRQREELKKAGKDDDRKRKYNSSESTEVTPEDMEAYRRSKINSNDPMAKFMQQQQDEDA